jgi:ABC-type nitrate/sulfonate/bicarbonate transport system permease component
MKHFFSFTRKYGPKLLYIVIFLALWQGLVMVFKIKTFIIPSPIKTLSHLFVPSIASKYNWFRHIQATAIEILLSFIVTASSGVLS